MDRAGTVGCLTDDSSGGKSGTIDNLAVAMQEGWQDLDLCGNPRDASFGFTFDLDAGEVICGHSGDEDTGLHLCRGVGVC